MLKSLTESLREKYLCKAREKVLKDTQESIAFIKSKGLDCHFEIERCFSANEAEHHYYVAKKLWEADGYYDSPTEFTRISERDTKFINEILKGLLKDD
jgi:hypothetical protein